MILRLEDSHRLNEREKESVDYSDEKVVVKYTCSSLPISILVRKNHVIHLIICCKWRVHRLYVASLRQWVQEVKQLAVLYRNIIRDVQSAQVQLSFQEIRELPSGKISAIFGGSCYWHSFRKRAIVCSWLHIRQNERLLIIWGSSISIVRCERVGICVTNEGVTEETIFNTIIDFPS